MILAVTILYSGNILCVGKASQQSSLLLEDVLIPPDLPPKHNSSITPGYYETSEYLIGSVAVGVILLESNGTLDSNTENWTLIEETKVVSEIQNALDWWSSQNPNASVSFTMTVNYQVPTRYEPITRAHTYDRFWISEAMSYLGYPGAYYFTQVRDYVNNLRNNMETNWAFAIFVVDSSNDPDGKFADDRTAYAYRGGPFFVMTYDNGEWGIDNMNRVAAHEIGHIFYATDEYNGKTEYSGYLNVSDVEGSGALMDRAELWLSSGTWGQVGWRDTDGDGIQDIVDTFPDTRLNPYFPNPTTNTTLVYTGAVREVPYPNRNPLGGKDITINFITNVQYRVDYGEWMNASPTDGTFDEATEDFSFTLLSLSIGTHVIETRGINSMGNVKTSYSSDTVTILVDSTPPTTIHDYDGLWHTSNFTINLIATDDDGVGVAETYYKINNGSIQKLSTDGQPYITTESANNTLEFWSIDYEGYEEPHNILTEIKLDKTAPTGSITINNGDIYTNLTSVILTLTAIDATSGVYLFRYSNDGLWDTESWEDPSQTKAWILSPGDGMKTVYFQIKDRTGLISETYSDSIILDSTSPTGTITINDGAVYTTTNRVKLTLSATDAMSGIAEIRFSNENFVWSPWENFTASKFWTLTAGDGTKTVYYQIKDIAGSISDTYFDTIVLDTNPPHNFADLFEQQK
jgi:hypothetical protein